MKIEKIQRVKRVDPVDDEAVLEELIIDDSRPAPLIPRNWQQTLLEMQRYRDLGVEDDEFMIARSRYRTVVGQLHQALMSDIPLEAFGFRSIFDYFHLLQTVMNEVGSLENISIDTTSFAKIEFMEFEESEYHSEVFFVDHMKNRLDPFMCRDSLMNLFQGIIDSKTAPKSICITGLDFRKVDLVPFFRLFENILGVEEIYLDLRACDDIQVVSKLLVFCDCINHLPLKSIKIDFPYSYDGGPFDLQKEDFDSDLWFVLSRLDQIETLEKLDIIEGQIPPDLARELLREDRKDDYCWSGEAMMDDPYIKAYKIDPKL